MNAEDFLGKYTETYFEKILMFSLYDLLQKALWKFLPEPPKVKTQESPVGIFNGIPKANLANIYNVDFFKNYMNEYLKESLEYFVEKPLEEFTEESLEKFLEQFCRRFRRTDSQDFLNGSQ